MKPLEKSEERYDIDFPRITLVVKLRIDGIYTKGKQEDKILLPFPLYIRIWSVFIMFVKFL